MREPSIHITRTVFIRITKELGIRLSKPHIDQIMRAARELSIDNRSMIAHNNKQRKQLRKSEGTIQEANLVAQIIYTLRVKMGHIGVTKIKQTSPTWGQIRELVPALNQFCETYELDKREGYITYIRTALEMMNKSNKVNYNYCASWMLKQASFIIQTYESNRIIREDPYPQNTQELMSIYQAKATELTGMYIDYSKNTQEYIHFVKARQMADKFGIDYDTYINAQFAALSFCNGLPNIKDLDNEKAEQRLAQYVAKQGIQIRKVKLSDDTWEQFKK